MKVVIFADKSYNYVKPISVGLHNTLLNIGVESELWDDGVYWLAKLNLVKVLFADIYRFFLNIKNNNRKLYLYRFWNLITFYNKQRRKQLRECDCIIVVLNCPACFYPGSDRLELLRKEYNKPIINYDFHYLPNQGWWHYISQIPNHKGLERFDWYLPIGLITEFPIPHDIPRIYNCIGMDITSSELFPEQTEFTVLLDFPRKEHTEQRARIKEVLDRMSVKWIELSGRYTTSQIRAIYRKCSLYVVSTRESFGLPIIELQLCGAKILTPYKEWVPAHYLNKSPFVVGSGDLGRNFLVYNNDEGTLCEIINKERDAIDYSQNINNFKKDYPYYNKINRIELKDFLEKISKKEINSSTHEKHLIYNKYLSLTDNYRKADEQYK